MSFLIYLAEDLRKDYSEKKWFHGTGHDIKKFDYGYLNKGQDALGVGFYFTDNPSTASGYAGDSLKDAERKRSSLPSEPQAPNVIPVHLKLKKATSHTKSLTRNQIGKIIKDAPEYKDRLYNFGDVDHDGEHRVLNKAISSYQDSTALDAKHLLFNDFYNNHPEEFLKAFTKHTGYDHSYHVQQNGEHHVVVFHPTQIKSVHSKFKKRNADLLEDKISNCPECGSPYSLIEKRMFGSATCKQGHTYKPIITYGEF